MALHSADAGGGDIASVSAERTMFQDALDDVRRSRHIEAVITVMEKFGDSAYIQRSGCEALQGQFLQVRVALGFRRPEALLIALVVPAWPWRASCLRPACDLFGP